MADINVSLQLDNSQFNSSIAAAETKAKNFSNNTQQGFSHLNESMARLSSAAIALGGALAGIGAIASVINFADELNDLSNATDVGVGKILQLQGALAASGGKAEDAGTMIAKLQRELQGARLGSAEAQNSLAKLGFTLADMSNLTPQEAIQKTINALAAMPDATERNALAFQLLGRSAASIDWAGVQAGTAGSTEKYDKFAYAAQLAGEFSDKLGAAMKSLKLALLDAIVPLLELSKVLEKFPGLQKLVEGIVATFKIGFQAVALIISDVAFVIDRLVAGVVALYEAGGQAIKGNFSGAKETIRSYNAESDKLRANLEAYQKSTVSIESQQQKIAKAADDAAKKAKDLKAAATSSAGIELASAGAIRSIQQQADVYALLNQKVRDKIALDSQNLTLAQEEVRVNNEVLRINQAAADAIAKLSDQRAKLKDNLNDNAQKSAIDATIVKIKEQAAIDIELTTTTIRNAESRARSLADTVNAYNFAGEGLYKLLGLEAKRLELGKDINEKSRLEGNLNQIYAERAALLASANKQLGSQDAARLNEVLGSAVGVFDDLSLSSYQASQSFTEFFRIAAQDAGFTSKQIENIIQYAAKSREAASAVNALTASRQKDLEVGQQLENLRLFGIKQRIDSENQLQKIQDDTAKLTMTSIEKKYYDIEAAARASAKAAIEAEEARTGRRLNVAEQEEYYKRASANTEKLQKSTKQFYENSREFSTGWKRAMNDYVESAGDAASRAESLFKKATSGMEDAIVSFAKTGKFEWSSFVNMMAEELLRSQVRDLMASIFNGFSGKGNAPGGGGFWSGLKSFLGFANGGLVPTNFPVLVGERGPELISGAAGRYVTPNNMLGGGSTNVVYNISAVDAPSFQALVARDPEFIYAVTQRGAMALPGARR